MKHYRSTKTKYDKHNKNDSLQSNRCPFCDIDSQSIIEETETVYVIKNRVKYDLFDGAKVLDHLMVIPKAHRRSITEFTDQEVLDAFRLAGRYEMNGYGFYGRGVGSVMRSLEHQHSHLIKLADTPAKLVVYASTPYTLLVR